MTTVFNEDFLRQYYNRLFPFELMYDWLAYTSGKRPAIVSTPRGAEVTNASKAFAHREFSFTLANDVYVRFKSFRDLAEFRAKVLPEQQNDLPHKIDIGAIYTAPADDAKGGSVSVVPVERELVFDVDLTDYEEVMVGSRLRKGEGMWARNKWQYMALAIAVVDRALREDFGFNNLLWVYSGRRGVHCWVCDPAARRLTDEERSSVVDYLTIVVGGEAMEEVPGEEHHGSTTSRPSNSLDHRVRMTQWLEDENGRNTEHMIPSVARALKMCRNVFLTAVLNEETGQGLLHDQARWERVLDMIPDLPTRERLSLEWQKKDSKLTSETRWMQLEQLCKSRAESNPKLLHAADAIVLYHTYPRLDVNVSKHRNHLLKSPWVIHPKTGSVAVPIMEADPFQFNPETVPNLVTVLEEYDRAAAKSVAAAPAEEGSEPASKRLKQTQEAAVYETSLGPILKAFKKSFLEPLFQVTAAEFAESQEARQAADRGARGLDF